MTRNMMTKTFKHLVAIGLAVGLVQSASAQPAGQTNYQWSAGGDKMTWSQGANWTQGTAPLTDGTTWQIDMSANAGGSVVPITIAASDVVNINDAIFGPLWGQTLNVYGKVSCGFGAFIWGDAISGVTTINLYTNSSLTLKDTLALGTAWWFPGGALVTMNVYSNAQVGVNYLQFGGHLNIYGGGTVSVTNALNTGTATTPVFAGGVDTDATRAINLTAGATLVLPASYTATVNDWITRGILQTYGSPASSAEIVIDEANTNWVGRTVVTTTATGPSSLVAVRIEVPRTNLLIGGVEQAQVFADYTTATNVNVTLSATNLIYRSSATNVVTVTAGGLVRATGVGSATVKAIIGSLSNSVLVAVTAYTNSTSLVHRYSFSDALDSTTAADSIGGLDWDGTLVNGAAFNGSQVVLDGSSGFVRLPAGILTNMDAVTIETWASFGTISNWAVLFTFGDSDGSSGHNYISFQPHTGGATAQAGIRNASFEQNPVFTPVLDGFTNVHIVAVYHPSAGYLSVYTNGVLAAINSSITILLPDALSTGDPYNFIGHSLWINDPYLATHVDEFRIYNGPLTAGQIKADAALGPNQLIGTSTNVSLTMTHTNSNVVFSWPTTSALVNLVSSPVLGAGAVWTPVNLGSLVVVGGNYQVTVPATGNARFFRLQY